MLRDYQEDIIKRVYTAWNEDKKAVLVQLATGGGKTRIFTEIIAQLSTPTVVIAHRVELVSQISLALAARGVRHNIIAQRGSIRDIVSLHVREHERSFYDPQNLVRVASVDTLLRWKNIQWFDSIKLVVLDEAHHVLKNNKWGKAAAMFPNARVLGVTATPCRADKKGLGQSADGIMDVMIEGPPMRQLINEGYLTDYRIFAPSSTLDITSVPLSASGEFSPGRLREEVHKSSITGDVVKHYLRIAPGKLGVTFAVDIEHATEIASAYRAEGIKAEVISSKTPDLARAQIMRDFRERKIMQIVNVDILGEGVDVPALEVVSLARPTMSYALYAQQIGRALRPLQGKTHALIIDHVSNTIRHGLVDTHRVWTLHRRPKNSKLSTGDEVSTCLRCFQIFERKFRTCPHCGFYLPPISRSGPEFVDGDLTELDAETLARMRGEIARIDGPAHPPSHLSGPARIAITRAHHERQQAQAELRKAIAQWAGYPHQKGATDSEIYREFYLTFGVDIATAQTLNVKDAAELQSRLLVDHSHKNKLG